MLTISVSDIYDERTQSFMPDKIYTFEHSLLSISEWEMVFKKPFPFLSGLEYDPYEVLAYIPMMALTPNFNINDLSEDNIKQVIAYINEKPTATKITNDEDNSASTRLLTSEVIYAYMANAQVPFTCETWNIHRLMTLLGVIGELNKPKKKEKKEDTMSRYAKLNAERRAKYNSAG